MRLEVPFTAAEAVEHLAEYDELADLAITAIRTYQQQTKFLTENPDAFNNWRLSTWYHVGVGLMHAVGLNPKTANDASPYWLDGNLLRYGFMLTQTEGKTPQEALAEALRLDMIRDAADRSANGTHPLSTYDMQVLQEKETLRNWVLENETPPGMLQHLAIDPPLP